jgi:hypothetical protein
LTDYTALDTEEIFRIGDDFFQIVQKKDSDGYDLQEIESDYCDACEENTIENPCEQCDHDKRKPTMGGYDPELDTDG